MSDTQLDPKKELAKLKRLATEIAGQIHDIVEEGLWTDYEQMPELSAQLVAACHKAMTFKQEQGL
ncbi:MAG: hypothetical protein A2508_08750 [Candidatus Lambdaproteobacteria bacterium RIFOXYD12_FULL_49_8]|uniref:Uncharacterized protein n=1 Tax=Candidatus Lambdaproteobacteria bacterium RIFOXYD2_FULL_50_16 TaxID=1817772 RepID=A0A1F6GAF9_9PROT|nr:MAG: hypothetical protein A2527_07935 [Candidatus Lambdaproteobacteria bacterium RIFOXYD2_FULL_50_16]OGG98019.1 MAG: hypothetical protein A2508_08750 [Candidatus Lambdaproteobacteria bacterium RIFOXYD12_FULL_49_8]